MGVYIIAEAGVNHNGSLELAKKLVDEAKAAGADCVKFQTFKTENLVAGSAKMADYQVKNLGESDSQFNMLKKLELSFDDFRELKKYCEQVEIDFLSTPFDLESLDFLIDLGLNCFKIPSGEVTNLPYLERIGQLEGKVIISTGMCTEDEIMDAVNVLKKCGTKDITVLHCTTEYPAPFAEVNLNVMNTFDKLFRLPIGYSDHTEGITVPVAAVALGATVIEKHFTLDKNMEGPDHKASLNPAELKEMVKAIRTVELALGSSVKKPCEAELANRKAARKSIVAACDIKAGEEFTEENLTCKRPGNGISPMKWYDIIGTKAARDYKADELIEE